MKSDNQPRVLIVFGTRPELIKLAPLISIIEKSDLRKDFLLASTSQHTELLQDQFDFWGFQPDIQLDSSKMLNLTRMLASSLSQLQDVIDQHPSLEYIFIQGDTNTALACANLAFLNQKKLVHVEAGLRTHDLLNPFPEEYNRSIVSKVANFHFVPSDKSRNNLLDEGVHDTQIMVTGNTVIDALQMSLSSTETQPANAIKQDVIITLHRRENAVHFNRFVEIVQKLKARFPYLNFTWITHPNYSGENQLALDSLSGISISKHLSYAKFIRLYKSARFVITDSGGVTEEASQLGIPVAVFRKVNDRSEPLDMGHAMIVSTEEKDILSFFEEHIDHLATQQSYFGDGNASQLIFEWIKTKLDRDE